MPFGNLLRKQHVEASIVASPPGYLADGHVWVSQNISQSVVLRKGLGKWYVVIKFGRSSAYVSQYRFYYVDMMASTSE